MILEVIRDNLLSFLLITYAIVIGISAYFLLKIYLERIKARKKIFIETIIKGLESSVVNSLDDIINIYKGVYRTTSEDYRYGLNNLLRAVFVEIVSENLSSEKEQNQIIEWKEFISQAIKKNEEVSPFSELPDIERNLLNDILTFIKAKDIGSAQNKLKELAGVIQANIAHQLKLEKNNKWSIPIAIIGVILTLVFGALSLSK